MQISQLFSIARLGSTLIAIGLSTTCSWGQNAFEPDNTAALAKVIISGERQNRSIHRAGDPDWAKFTLTQRSEVRIETAGPSGDTELWLAASNGTTDIEYDDDDGNGSFSLINRTGGNALNAGTYYIVVEEYGNNGTLNAYTLALTVTPTLPQAAAPVLNPAPGVYEGEVVVSMSTTTVGATIRYTTSGNDPTSTSAQYAGPLRLTQSTTLKARTFQAGMVDSLVISDIYTITPRSDAYEPDNNAASAKTIASGERQNRSIHAAGNVDWATFTLTQRSEVRIETDGPSGDTELWLVASDGRTVIEEDDDDGNGSFSLINRTGANVMNAGTYYIVIEEYGNNGTLNAYTLALTVTPALPQAAAPVFNPAPGVYEGEVTVAMSTTTAGATIRYTTSGNDPTSASAQYPGPLRVTQTTTLKARTFQAGMVDSIVTTGIYTITPRGDAYEPDNDAASAKVIISGERQNRSIHRGGDADWVKFTLTQRSDVRVETDGLSGDTELWLTASNAATVIEYDDDDGNGSFSLINRTGGNALNAGTYYIVVEEYGNNETITAYTLALTVTAALPQAAAPALNPAPGVYEGEVIVSVSTTTVGATIHYTTSGNDPTSGSPQYTAPVRLTQTTTLKARAFNAAMTDSSITGGNYTITPRRDAFEPDDTPGAAKTIVSGVTQNRSIHAAGNVDWATFTVGANGASNVRVETDGSSGGDTEMRLYGPNSSTTQVPGGYSDDEGNGSFSLIALSNLAAGVYYIKVSDYYPGETISAYTLRASWTDNTGGPSGAMTLVDNVTVNESILQVGNVDWFKFTLPASSSLWNLRLETDSTAGDTVMYLYGPNSSTTLVKSDDDGGNGKFSLISRNTGTTALPPGTYYAKVEESGNNATIPAYTIRAHWTPRSVTPPAQGQKVLLLLHGMNSNPEDAWNYFAEKRFTDSAPVIFGGERVRGGNPIPDSHGVVCYRVDFGYYDKTSGRTGVEPDEVKATGDENGDFSTFDTLGLEVWEAVNYILSVHPGAQIAILGHSRGGLAARAFLQDPASSPEKSSVVALLTTGTPHKGSRLGRIYKYLTDHTRATKNGKYWEDDWEAVKQILVKSGLDVRRPVIDDVSDVAPGAVPSLNDTIGNLPRGISYGAITYTGVTLGHLARIGLGFDYYLFPSDPNARLGEQVSTEAEDAMLDAGKDPKDYLGDGIVPVQSQRYDDIPGFPASKLAPFPHDNDVLHTEETDWELHMTSALNSLLDWWR